MFTKVKYKMQWVIGSYLDRSPSIAIDLKFFWIVTFELSKVAIFGLLWVTFNGSGNFLCFSFEVQRSIQVDLWISKEKNKFAKVTKMHMTITKLTVSSILAWALPKDFYAPPRGPKGRGVAPIGATQEVH